MDKKKPSHDAAAAAEPRAHHRPIWSQTVNRVESSIWKHDHNGTARYSVSICRSYFDKKSDKVVRNHYFDEQDLKDVIACANAARDYLKASELANDAYVD
jgi:hypothetical protein